MTKYVTRDNLDRLHPDVRKNLLKIKKYQNVHFFRNERKKLRTPIKIRGFSV